MNVTFHSYCVVIPAKAGTQGRPVACWRSRLPLSRERRTALPGRIVSDKLFDRVALIGIGLIGSSLARVLRRDSPATEIVACARRPETLAAVERLELADKTTHDPAEAADGADLVVLATPLSAYAEIGRRIAPALKPGAILTDVGSVKEVVVRDLAPHIPPGVHFVPGHPVAGTEHSGPEAGFAELFHDRWCILIPLPETTPEAVAKIGRMWELAGLPNSTRSPTFRSMGMSLPASSRPPGPTAVISPWGGFLLGGIRDDDAACGLLFGIEAPDDDAVVKRTKLHGVLLSY